MTGTWLTLVFCAAGLCAADPLQVLIRSGRKNHERRTCASLPRRSSLGLRVARNHAEYTQVVQKSARAIVSAECGFRRNATSADRSDLR